MKAYCVVISYVAVCFAVQESSSFVSKDDIIKCHHLDQSFREVLSRCTRGLNLFESVEKIRMKTTKQYFPVVLCKLVLTSKSADEILKCDHSNESY